MLLACGVYEEWSCRFGYVRRSSLAEAGAICRGGKDAFPRKAIAVVLTGVGVCQRQRDITTECVVVVGDDRRHCTCRIGVRGQRDVGVVFRGYACPASPI